MLIDSIVSSFNTGAGIKRFDGMLAVAVFLLTVILFLSASLFAMRQEYRGLGKNRNPGEALIRLFKIFIAVAVVLSFFALLSF